jgi:hypothetical protein
MTLYDTKVLKQNKFVDSIETTIQMVRKDHKPIMDVQDIRDLVDGIQNAADKKNQDIKIMVRVMAADGMKTLKGYKTDLMVDEFEDYYRNSVKDASKFNYFSQIQISVIKIK